MKLFYIFLSAVLIFASGATKVLADDSSSSVLYVPLIGITSVPNPLARPNGGGNVTYNYAVKNFLAELPLTNINVVDDNCSPVVFTEGDDNGNNKLDYSETWRYTCITYLSQTTQSTATAIGLANSISATHKAYTTVVVGSTITPPIVSIVNITKVAYPLSLPSEGGEITFTYKVNNPGIEPLSGVTVTDDKCKTLSGKLGDTNGNNLLDPNEVWIYTCATTLKETTTNTVHVIAFANGLKAVDDATLTVKVDSSLTDSSPDFPNTGIGSGPNFKLIAWGSMMGLLAILLVIFLSTRNKNIKYKGKDR